LKGKAGRRSKREEVPFPVIDDEELIIQKQRRKSALFIATFGDLGFLPFCADWNAECSHKRVLCVLDAGKVEEEEANNTPRNVEVSPITPRRRRHFLAKQ
jgi:hypothetical protein